MRYRQLGRAGVRVSEICLGTMNFGSRTSEDESFAILDRAIDAGVNFLDTADQYGGDAGVGATESLLGRWFAAHPGVRDRVVLATKVHEPMSDDVNDRGLSAFHIRRACDESLRRLGVDHIDLYQLHHVDRAVPVDEIWSALDVLQMQGKISYVGTSNFPGWAIARMQEQAPGAGVVSEQHLYNLVERRAELEVLPACEAYGVGVIPWSPLAGGLLAGPPADGAGGRRSSKGAQAARAALADKLGSFEALAGEVGTTPSGLALAWLLTRPAVASVITGPATIDQLEGGLAAADVELTDATRARIDEIFPSVGPAPEAYAW